jgi:hypothetical protein
MIYETLQILKEQLENYFSDIGLGKIIILENIALWESGSDDANRIDDKVVISLLKLEEEVTLKNIPHYKINDTKTEYKNPPVHLNLYLLISANCDTYDKSLRSISKVIEFFQGKKVFTSANTVYNRTNVAFDVLDYFKFILELYTPTFEELNNIWGTLGGRQLPSAIYKVQLIQIEQDKKLAAAEVITHIGGTLNDFNQ